MSHTETAMNIETCESRDRDFNRMPQHQTLTYFTNLYLFSLIGALPFIGCLIY